MKINHSNIESYSVLIMRKHSYGGSYYLDPVTGERTDDLKALRKAHKRVSIVEDPKNGFKRFVAAYTVAVERGRIRFDFYVTPTCKNRSQYGYYELRAGAPFGKWTHEATLFIGADHKYEIQGTHAEVKFGPCAGISMFLPHWYSMYMRDMTEIKADGSIVSMDGRGSFCKESLDLINRVIPLNCGSKYGYSFTISNVWQFSMIARRRNPRRPVSAQTLAARAALLALPLSDASPIIEGLRSRAGTVTSCYGQYDYVTKIERSGGYTVIRTFFGDTKYDNTARNSQGWLGAYVCTGTFWEGCRGYYRHGVSKGCFFRTRGGDWSRARSPFYDSNQHELGSGADPKDIEEFYEDSPIQYIMPFVKAGQVALPKNDSDWITLPIWVKKRHPSAEQFVKVGLYDAVTYLLWNGCYPFGALFNEKPTALHDKFALTPWQFAQYRAAQIQLKWTPSRGGYSSGDPVMFAALRHLSWVFGAPDSRYWNSQYVVDAKTIPQNLFSDFLGTWLKMASSTKVIDSYRWRCCIERGGSVKEKLSIYKTLCSLVIMTKDGKVVVTDGGDNVAVSEYDDYLGARQFVSEKRPELADSFPLTFKDSMRPVRNPDGTPKLDADGNQEKQPFSVYQSMRASHDAAMAQKSIIENASRTVQNAYNEKQYRTHLDKLAGLAYSPEGSEYEIIVPTGMYLKEVCSANDYCIENEGAKMHHCVFRYYGDRLIKGSYDVVLLRKKSDPSEPLATIGFRDGDTIDQTFLNHDHSITKEIAEFILQWISAHKKRIKLAIYDDKSRYATSGWCEDVTPADAEKTYGSTLS